MTSPYSDLYDISWFFFQVRWNIIFFPKSSMLIGYTNVQYPKCNRPCVVELLRHSRRKGVISSTLLPLFIGGDYQFFTFFTYSNVSVAPPICFCKVRELTWTLEKYQGNLVVSQWSRGGIFGAPIVRKK